MSEIRSNKKTAPKKPSVNSIFNLILRLFNGNFSKRANIMLLVLCTFLVALGQFCLKKGVSNISLTLPNILSNYIFILGCLIYGFTAMLFILLLKNLDLSAAYPGLSLSFVWVSLVSVLFLSESLHAIDWLGIICIIIGVISIGRGVR